MTLATDEFIRRFLIHVLPRASTASATTACSPTAPAPTTSPAPANCSPWQNLNGRAYRMPIVDPGKPQPVHAAAVA